jgi:hypothetical protein
VIGAGLCPARQYSPLLCAESVSMKPAVPQKDSLILGVPGPLRSARGGNGLGRS